MADRGRAGVGVSNALTFGARYELPTGMPYVSVRTRGRQVQRKTKGAKRSKSP